MGGRASARPTPSPCMQVVLRTRSTRVDTPRLQRHLRLVASLHLAYGLLVLVSAAVAFFVLAPGATEPLQRRFWMTAGISWAVLGTLALFVGVTLRQGRDIGRMVGLFLSLLNLFHVPVGTALGLYTFWVLLEPGVAPLLSPRGRRPPSPTPQGPPGHEAQA
jgi:hypothetical protein